MKKSIAIILILSVAALCLAGCLRPKSPSSKADSVEPASSSVDLLDAKESGETVHKEEEDPVTAAYETGNYLEAIELYEDALRDPSASITDQMKEAYDASFVQYREAAYAKAEKAFGANRDYNAAIQVLNGAIDAAYAYESITGPLESKISEYVMRHYEDDMDKAFQAGDYLETARQYESIQASGAQVSEHMTELYTVCFSKYLEEAYAAAEKALGADKDYDAAIRTINRYMEEAEASSYYDLYSSLENKVYDYLGAKYADLVDKAYKEGNYLEAARKYEEASIYDAVITNKSMKQQYEDSVSEYLKKVSDEAASAFGSNKDYNAAMTRIRMALSEANDVEAIVGHLESLMEEYSTYVPVPLLTTLKYTNKSSNIELGSSYTDRDLLRDVSDNQYDSDTVLYYSDPFELSGSGENTVHIEFSLNYQYSKLSGTVYRPYSTLACQGEWSKPGGARIYGDNQLLYESPEITQSTFDAIPFSIDVSGVRILRIELYGRWGTQVAIGVYDYSSKACLGNLMLQK